MWLNGCNELDEIVFFVFLSLYLRKSFGIGCYGLPLSRFLSNWFVGEGFADIVANVYASEWISLHSLPTGYLPRWREFIC